MTRARGLTGGIVLMAALALLMAPASNAQPAPNTPDGVAALFDKLSAPPPSKGGRAALASRAGKPLASTPNIERIAAAATLWFYGSTPPGQLPYGSGVFAFATILLLSLGVRGLGRK